MNWYKTSWDNTTDNSKRLKIIVDGLGTEAGDNNQDPEDKSQTITWVNVTTEINSFNSSRFGRYSIDKL